MKDVLAHVIHCGDSIGPVATFILSPEGQGTKVDLYLVDEDTYTLALASDLLAAAATVVSGYHKNLILQILRDIDEQFNRLSNAGEN